MNVELETEGMTLNIGPQHPATHGTLRIIVRLDGEQVIAAEPVPGYMHRGYEKLTEVRTYPQVTTLVNRIDWLGSFANEVPFILAAERLMDIEAPPRAQWIRTCSSSCRASPTSCCSSATWRVQLGAITPVFYAFRDREYVLNQIEAVTGGRFHPNFDRIGGLKDDLPKGWIAETKQVMEKIRAFCDEMEELLVGNEIFAVRTRGIGVVPPEVALSYGLSGANLRASGVDCDHRRDTPVRPGLRPARLEGLDPSRRRLLRPLLGAAAGDPGGHATSSSSASTGCPSGPIMAKVPRIIKVPEGEAFVATENPLGEMAYYVVSKGDLGAVPGEDPLGQLQQHLDRAVAAAGRLRARRDHASWPASTSSSETSTGEPGCRWPAVDLAYWQQTDAAQRRRAARRAAAGRARSSTSSCSR